VVLSGKAEPVDPASSGRWPPPFLVRAVGRHRVAAALGLTYLAGFGVYGLAAGRPSTGLYLLTVVSVAAVLAAVDRSVGLSSALVLGLALWGFLHVAGGLVPWGHAVLYNADLHVPTLHYDRLVHALGFGLAGVACWQALRRHVATRPVTAGVAFIVGLAGMGVGAMNELVEFGITHLVRQSAIGGYQNTGWDLVFDAIGCTVAALWVYRTDRAGRHAPSPTAVASMHPSP
jgi:uncharacterized membrane protein YjdF